MTSNVRNAKSFSSAFCKSRATVEDVRSAIEDVNDRQTKANVSRIAPSHILFSFYPSFGTQVDDLLSLTGLQAY